MSKFKIKQIFQAGLDSDENISIPAGKNFLKGGVPIGSVSFGANNQIPVMNTGGTDFDYSANFLFDGLKLFLGNILNIGSQSTYPATPAEGDIIRLVGHISDPDSYYAYVNGSWLDVLSQGGASFDEVTVGATGANYTTFKAAVDAGYERILVVDNTTEIANIDATGKKLHVRGINKDVTVNLGASTLTISDSTFENLTITFNPVADTIVAQIDNTFIDCIIQKLSGSNTYFSNASSRFKFYRCKFIMNDTRGLIRVDGSIDKATLLDSCEIVGGGSNCDFLIWYGERETILRNCIISGTFTATNWIFSKITLIDCVIRSAAILDQCHYFNVDAPLATFRFSQFTTTTPEYYIVNCTVGYIMTVGNFVSIALFSGVVVKNTATLYVDYRAIFEGCVFESAIDVVWKNSKFTDCYFEDNLTISANNNILANCSVLGDVVVAADNITIDNAVVGDIETGGSTETITINSGSDNIIVKFSRTDAAIVDNGAGNQLFGNLEY